MKRTVLLLLHLFFLIPYTVNGQDINYINRTLQDFAAELRFLGSSTGNGITKGVKETVEGTEYLNDIFIKGEIFTLSSERFSGIPMRYNALEDEIEIQMPDGMIYNLINTRQILKVQLNNEILVFSPFISTEGTKTGFLFVLYSGKSALYQRKLKIYKERVPSNGILNEIPPKIVDKPKEYYIKLKDGIPQLCKTKKGLSEMLESNGSAIEAYLKKEKINTNDEADLIKVLTYFDSL